MSKKLENVISIRDFDRDGLLSILEMARAAEGTNNPDLLKGHVLGIMFIEPSTRTRLSFAAAMVRLGGEVLDFGDPSRSSLQKGESLADTLKTFSSYCDVMTIRHPLEGVARLAAQIAGIPVINAGDGANQHPTQTFLDLYTIQKTCGRLDNLKVGFIGDLRYSRTVHSLAEALSWFEDELYFISPEVLKAPGYLLEELEEKEVVYDHFNSPEDVLPELDVLYCTRIQEERFADRLEYEQVKSCYRIRKSLLEECGVKESLKIMHPLPRVDELADDIDNTPYGVYFQQARNGIPIRQALLSMLLQKNI